MISHYSSRTAILHRFHTQDARSLVDGYRNHRDTATYIFCVRCAEFSRPLHIAFSDSIPIPPRGEERCRTFLHHTCFGYFYRHFWTHRHTPLFCNGSRSWQREDREWLESLPYTLRFPSLGCIIVHAGLVPGVSLEEQDLGAMTRMRNVVDQGGGIFTSREHLSEGTLFSHTGTDGPGVRDL